MCIRDSTNISNWNLHDKIRWTEETKDIANVPRLSTLNNANNCLLYTSTGNVRDERGDEVIGATVLLIGSQHGVITDVDGNFKLNVPNAKTGTSPSRSTSTAELLALCLPIATGLPKPS